MPQENPIISYKIGDTTYALEPGYLPNGFDTLPLATQDQIRYAIDSIKQSRDLQQQQDASVSFAHFCWSAVFGALLIVVLTLALGKFFDRLQGILKQEFSWFFIVGLSLFIPAIYYDIQWLSSILLFLIIIALIIVVKKAGVRPEDTPTPYAIPPQEDYPQEQVLQYRGSELNFSHPQIHDTLTKRWNYYSTLTPFNQQRFVGRLQEFIAIKTFCIYDKNGFLEMPILISAAAIQLTFGLDEYLLKNFPVINIHPEEFIGVHPFIRFLEGNVSNGCINLSWKHFLLESSITDDGQNVGLHEMSHALYCECFADRGRADKLFQKTYEEFNTVGGKLFQTGKPNNENLFCDYAYKNIQEFWAVSIEIFFERSIDMQNKYPELYAALCDILNQNPANKIAILKSLN
ncbi:zinc-dependent peptidase [Ferruginibacter albus]|uniref:zinc-dependent peptidase n=1 Tax=Ferruginibacter albus TaxID=2875540 RepID=UPI001CC75ECA|nr:zinc-dependent peptidase [Ferruginibacter albus]UAY51338.1 zinc-dependent peptidase [Ferruginibacter albus]